MILDDNVIKFLQETEPLFIHLAVSNSDGRPFSTRCFGVRTHKGLDYLSVYVLKSQKSKILTYLTTGSGALACLFTDGFSNESYQIKGLFIESKSATLEEDGNLLDSYRKGSLYLFPKFYSKFPLSPTICDCITYQVKEIFVQTPGPYAGNRYQQRGSHT